MLIVNLDGHRVIVKIRNADGIKISIKAEILSRETTGSGFFL